MDLTKLIEERNRLAREMDIHALRGSALQKKFEGAVLALQEVCPHAEVKTQSSYHSGGYDYCAETIHNTYCTTCGFLVETRTDLHHGRFG